MNVTDREKLWQERVAQFQASGLTQRAYATKHGFPAHQVSYWVRRFTGEQTQMPAMLPVRVAPTIGTADAIDLRGGNGWTLTLPSHVPASWLAELLRAL